MPQFTRDQAILAVLEQGRSLRSVARDAGVTAPTIKRWVDAFTADVPAAAPEGPPPDLRAAVAAVRDRGGAIPRTAREHGISVVELSRALRDAPPAEAPAPPPDAPAPADDGTTRALVAELMAEYRRLGGEIERARADGNTVVVQRTSKLRVDLLADIRRLKKIEADDGGEMVRVPRADLDAAIATLAAKLQAACDRPLLCAQCARELAIEWAGLQPSDVPSDAVTGAGVAAPVVAV